MEKRALLVYGTPKKGEDFNKFRQFIEPNLRVMSDLAIREGHKVKIKGPNEFDPYFKEYSSDEDFLFYYTGHSQGEYLGDYYLEEIVDSVAEIKGKKLVVLDACSDVFIDNYNPKENMKIIGAFDVSYSSPIALSLYDAIIARGNSLEGVNKKTFQEMKHNWIKVKGNLNNYEENKNA